MRLSTTFATIAITLTVGMGQALAETRFDVGLLLGATKTSDETPMLVFDRGTTFQATVAWRIAAGSRTAVSIEVPFLASPAFTVVTPGGLLPKEYAALYLTPGIRLTFLPAGPVSIFGSVGGGYARYSESKERANGNPNPDQRDTNTGAFQVGGGADVRALRWLGFRAEIRDVYTGARNLSVATPHGNVHNVVVSGGLVVRF